MRISRVISVIAAIVLRCAAAHADDWQVWRTPIFSAEFPSKPLVNPADDDNPIAEFFIARQVNGIDELMRISVSSTNGGMPDQYVFDIGEGGLEHLGTETSSQFFKLDGRNAVRKTIDMEGGGKDIAIIVGGYEKVYVVECRFTDDRGLADANRFLQSFHPIDEPR